MLAEDNPARIAEKRARVTHILSKVWASEGKVCGKSENVIIPEKVRHEAAI